MGNFFINILKNTWRMFRIAKSENFRFLRFVPPGHYYSPIPDIKEIRSHSKIIFDRSIKKLPAINFDENSQLQLAQQFTGYYSEIPFPDKQNNQARYYFDNEYFSYGDAVSLYSMMRHFKPKRIIEVGSGFSSAAMLDIDDKFFNSNIEFTFIEPYPDRLLKLLKNKDKERCTILEKPVQAVSPDFFSKLQENDILFIDSSHVGKVHSDFLYLIFHVLPALNKGVIIHFHDIFWPFEYPESWFKFGRAWNEAYFLRTFLQYNQYFEILYFNSFMEYHHNTFLKENMPLALKTPLSDEEMLVNTSLWIKKSS